MVGPGSIFILFVTFGKSRVFWSGFSVFYWTCKQCNISTATKELLISVAKLVFVIPLGKPAVPTWKQHSSTHAKEIFIWRNILLRSLTNSVQQVENTHAVTCFGMENSSLHVCTYCDVKRQYFTCRTNTCFLYLGEQQFACGQTHVLRGANAACYMRESTHFNVERTAFCMWENTCFDVQQQHFLCGKHAF